jgi:hypothetical protein
MKATGTAETWAIRFMFPPHFLDCGTHQFRRIIWAVALRNPFTFAFQPGARLVINDVGQRTQEEINDDVAVWCM